MFIIIKTLSIHVRRVWAEVTDGQTIYHGVLKVSPTGGDLEGAAFLQKNYPNPPIPHKKILALPY